MKMDFGKALEILKYGGSVHRTGWNGKGLSLRLRVPDANSKMTLPYIYLCYPVRAVNTPGARVPWAPSQTDVLADDWQPAEDSLVHMTAEVKSAPPASLLPPHQQRVLDEKAELDEKLAKLDAFTITDRFLGLPVEEQSRMVNQSVHMRNYSEVLGARIGAFMGSFS